MAVTVTTQAELDKALADEQGVIRIDSPAETWLRVRKSGSSHVAALGSSHVVALGSSHVEAWDSSHVEALDYSHVEAWDSSHVEARHSSHVEARHSSHVEARHSSHVEARHSSHVEAGKYVTAHLYSKRVELTGGVVVDLTDIDLCKVDTWCEYHGAKRDGDTITVYKAVDDNLKSGRGFEYPIGQTVTAPDWDDTAECGNGLHFSYTPSAAQCYMPEATRFLECTIDATEAVALGDKIKAKSCHVVREVDIYGQAVES